MTSPNFLVIGAAKAGTTSLRGYLNQHPDVFVARRGEPSYFAHLDRPPTDQGPGDEEWSFVTRADDYADLFADAGGHKAVGEISPRYIYFPEAAENISRLVPEAKLIAILRHPVDRAYSHYLMNVQRGVEDALDLPSAIELEDQRRADGWGWDWQYTGLGRYHEQLNRYRSFFEARRIAVYDYRDYRDDPTAFFESVFRFLGVDPSFHPDTTDRKRRAEAPKSTSLRRLTSRYGPLRPLASILPVSLRSALGRSIRSANTKAPAKLDPEVRQMLFDKHFAQDQAKLHEMLATYEGLRKPDVLV